MTTTDSLRPTAAEVRLLNQAFTQLLGSPSVGSVGFCRCLRADLVEALAACRDFAPVGWLVWAVTEAKDSASRQITSDQAVELRENKRDAVLLLVDPQRAGAGMDGIYSAAREIDEEELFAQIRKLTRAELGPACFAKVEQAMKQARKVSDRRMISAWQEFEFLARVVADPADFGSSLAFLGLWPVAATPDEIEDKDFHLAARMVERLLIGTGVEKTLTSRVDALLLIGATSNQKDSLERLVREGLRRPVVEILRELIRRPDLSDLWLNNLKPGFLTQDLQVIVLESWRLRTGKLTAWSGLKMPETEGRPQLLLDRTVGDTGKQTQLEIRFTTQPTALQIACARKDHRSHQL